MTPNGDWYRTHQAGRSVSHRDAEICVNCWYFPDASGIVLRLAAKPYALTGTDDEKLKQIRFLAGADHLTAIHAKVSSKHVIIDGNQELKGVIPVAALQADPLPIFDELFSRIDEALPDAIVSINGEYEQRPCQLIEPFLWVLTSVLESEDGHLIAQISEKQ